jgi:hypothetical protein
LEAAAEEEDQQRHRDDVVELAGNLAVADRQAVQERNRRAGLEETQAVDFKDEVVAVRADVGVGDQPLAEISSSIRNVRLHPLAGEAALDRFHHLLRDRVARLLAAVAGDEGGILEFVRPGADQAVPVDVGGQDQAVGILSPRHQHALIVGQIQVQLLKFAKEHAEKRVLRAYDGRLADQVPQEVQEIVERGRIVVSRHRNLPAKHEGCRSAGSEIRRLKISRTGCRTRKGVDS